LLKDKGISLHESALDSSHHYKNYFTSGITAPNSKPNKNSANNNNNSYTDAQNPAKKKKKHKRTKSITLGDKHHGQTGMIPNNLSLKNCSSTVNTNHHNLHGTKLGQQKLQATNPKKTKTKL
jgi:hypothetical protein